MIKKISQEDILNIVNLYKTNLTMRDIAKLYNITNSYVYKILKTNGYVKKPQHVIVNKKYSFDRNFFKKDSWQLAYVMGFALADGHIVNNKHSSILSYYVHKKDAIILEKIKEFVKATHPIFTSHTKSNMIQISISDSIFVDTLSKWGVVSNKTYNPVIPQIPKHVLKPFLIGLIDGDGTIKLSNKSQFGLVGNKDIMDFFIHSMKILGFTPDWKIYCKDSNIWKRVKLYKKNLIIELVKTLEPEKFFYLPRKWSAVLLCIKNNCLDKRK
jgi:hypothetical protein